MDLLFVSSSNYTTSLNIKPQPQVFYPINPNPLWIDGLLSVPTPLISLTSNYTTYLILGSLIIGDFCFLQYNQLKF